MADIAYRQEDTIIAVDLANAFNTVRHGPIFDAIIERYNPIARFFRWKYGTPSEMRDHSVNVVAHTRTGVASSLSSATRLLSANCPSKFEMRQQPTTSRILRNHC
jgi:hypothetical protein